MKGEIFSANRDRMVELLERLAVAEGISPTRLAGVRVMRSSTAQPRRPVVYNPSIVIVAQGCKVGHLGEHSFRYDPGNFLVLSVPMPFECEIAQARPEAPFLGLSVGVDRAVLAEILVEMGEAAGQNPAVSGLSVGRLNAEMRDAAIRLLCCLQNDADARILGPQIVREIVYRVLKEEQGAVLKALIAARGSFVQIAQALHRIHTAYRTPLEVGELARTAGMSVSVFHQHFKTVTSTSPLQYIKSIRLFKARALMAQEGFTAKGAAGEVGYSSPSQFSREFKRLFGASPAEEATRVRGVSLPR
jgi:AraC-like DNA-binding protein